MTAHVNVRRYGTDTRTICDDCGLDQPHDRWHQAITAARQHDTDQHHDDRSPNT